MKIIWDNYERTKVFGDNIRGIIHEGVRPHTITYSVQETFHFRGNVSEYEQEMLAAAIKRGMKKRLVDYNNEIVTIRTMTEEEAIAWDKQFQKKPLAE